jgi:outer membrane protein OmpA-like peptidoglycan-associated protein
VEKTENPERKGKNRRVEIKIVLKEWNANEQK